MAVGRISCAAMDLLAIGSTLGLCNQRCVVICYCLVFNSILLG